MDRLTTISASFFMAADIFAIVSLATPDWIVTDVGGKFVLNWPSSHISHISILFVAQVKVILL